MGVSGTPKRAQETTLGLLLKGDWLEKALGVQGAVKPPIVADEDPPDAVIPVLQPHWRAGKWRRQRQH